MEYRIIWKGKYWNSCGWTDIKKNASTYSYTEAFEVVNDMLLDEIPAQMEKVG